METNLKTIVPVTASATTDVLGLNVTTAGAASNSEGFGVVVEQDGKTLSVGCYGGNAGPVEVKAAASITKGNLLKVTTGGKFTPISTKDIPNAVAIEDGAADELVQAVLLPPEV